MPKKADNLQKHTLNLFSGDYDRLQQLFPDLGAGPVIRKIVREFIERCESNGFDLPSVSVDL